MFSKLNLGVLVTLFATGVYSHMAMVQPCPRLSPNNPLCPAGDPVDYDIKSPIGTQSAANQPLCKTDRKSSRVVDTWTAGSTVTVKFRPDGAAHSGGHCQFALSYDGGKTFVVIKDVLRYCFFNGQKSGNTADVLSYTIQLPSNLPSSNSAVFAWTWLNASGNREYYMNCADIAIKGVNGGSYTGKKLLIANYGPGTPAVAEFNGNYESGISLLNSRPNITVNGSGGSSPAAGGGTPASSSSSIAMRATTTTSSAIKPTTGTCSCPCK
ncbi:hypothetical protein AX774_g7188 [Zancudomyces culisetae]|uniref:Uncharacterized protein n=1 Tax=Zancudomyces culisetae TaxID=1213189 RepID=A0A1R1PEK9_ZANCU|nr:hypothetical protein AX774_g7188 [Zancudomyces culisetae]|eukprot:OMH79396.1 hypothetical protein AX774_g7188 [Zancudomyces culisetae]